MKAGSGAHVDTQLVLHLIELCYRNPSRGAIEALIRAEIGAPADRPTHTEASNLFFVAFTFEEGSNLRQIIRLSHPHLPSDAWRDTAEMLFERIGAARDGPQGGKFIPFTAAVS